MIDTFLGAIVCFGFDFVPQGFLACNGALLSRNDYPALFTLIQYTYGGRDGSFALPNLNNGSAAVGVGPLPGGSTYTLGQTGGSNSVALTTPMTPPHSHPFTLAIKVNSDTVTSNSPANNYPGNQKSTNKYYGLTHTAGKFLKPVPVVTINEYPGKSVPVNIQRPSLTMNFCICIDGEFPQEG